jgi:hypothetical protein
MAIIRLFKIIALIVPIAAFVKRPSQRPAKTSPYRLYLEDEQWDSGEVSWDPPTTTQYSACVKFNDYDPVIIERKNDYSDIFKGGDSIKTPLYEKMQNDQTRLASVSAVAKMSYKELFNVDLFISELNCNIHKHTLFTPSEMFLLTALSGVAFIYNKTKETEINRLQRLYKFSSRSEYFEKYKEIRKFTMMAFIVITCLFTRNIQIAE